MVGCFARRSSTWYAWTLVTKDVAREGFLAHVISRRFVLTLVGLFAFDWALENTTIAKRATLGGFDTASGFLKVYPAERTAVIGIGALDVAKYFSGQRPVPPIALANVVTQLLRLNPSVLVVDVFTDGPGYADSLFNSTDFRAQQEAVVWAQALHPTTSEALPILSGTPNPPGRSGLAVMLADEDHLVRQFRPRFTAIRVGPGVNGMESLPLAAANAFRERLHRPVSVSDSIMADTESIGLRAYERNPPLYLLDDVLTAAASGAPIDSTLANKVLILGFIDGSDQLLTSRGVRAGPEVVADAVETLLDSRVVIRKLELWKEVLSKVLLALLVGFIHFRLPRQLAAVSMICLTIFVILGGLWVLDQYGYWINYVLIVVGFWIEQLYGDATHRDNHATDG